MPKQIVRTIIPNDSIFKFQATARTEGNNGLRIAIPAAIVRGLVHLGWEGRWLDVILNNTTKFKAAVRPHPTSVMFAIPKKYRGQMKSGDVVDIEMQKASGPRSPKTRCLRGLLIQTTPTLALPWLTSTSHKTKII